METKCSSEKPVDFQRISWFHIPEYRTLSNKNTITVSYQIYEIYCISASEDLLMLRLTYIKTLLFYCIHNVYSFHALIVLYSAIALKRMKTILNPTEQWTTKRVILNWKCFVKVRLWLRFMGPCPGTNPHTTTGPYQVTYVGCQCRGNSVVTSDLFTTSFEILRNMKTKHGNSKELLWPAKDVTTTQRLQ